MHFGATVLVLEMCPGKLKFDTHTVDAVHCGLLFHEI